MASLGFNLAFCILVQFGLEECERLLCFYDAYATNFHNWDFLLSASGSQWQAFVKSTLTGDAVKTSDGISDERTNHS